MMARRRRKFLSNSAKNRLQNGQLHPCFLVMTCEGTLKIFLGGFAPQTPWITPIRQIIFLNPHLSPPSVSSRGWGKGGDKYDDIPWLICSSSPVCGEGSHQCVLFRDLVVGWHKLWAIILRFDVVLKLFISKTAQIARILCLIELFREVVQVTRFSILPK